MAAIDDLNAAVTALQAEQAAIVTQLGTLSADLTAALAANDTAAIETAATNIKAVVVALQTAGTADAPPATSAASTGTASPAAPAGGSTSTPAA